MIELENQPLSTCDCGIQVQSRTHSHLWKRRGRGQEDVGRRKLREEKREQREGGRWELEAPGLPSSSSPGSCVLGPGSLEAPTTAVLSEYPGLPLEEGEEKVDFHS